MFATMSNPAAAYRKAGIETQIDTANPHKLVLMLYEGAITTIVMSCHHIDQKDIGKKCESIAKAIEIIDSGLKACLDYQAGGEIAERLGALYEYMCNRLVFANLKNDKGALQEVMGLLNDLKGAWQEIADDPAVLSKNKVAA